MQYIALKWKREWHPEQDIERVAELGLVNQQKWTRESKIQTLVISSVELVVLQVSNTYNRKKCLQQTSKQELFESEVSMYRYTPSYIFRFGKEKWNFRN